MGVVSRYVGDLTWGEYRDAVKQRAIMILPVGSLEQHGLHLPLNTDTEQVQTIALRVADAVDGFVLPPLTYGARSLPRSGGGDIFPGTTNLDGTTLIALVRDIVREQSRHQVERIVLLSGHSENDPFLVEGAELGRRDAGSAAPEILVVGWWNVVSGDALEPIFPEGFPGWDLEHAARIETSLMLALSPESVRLKALAGIDPIIAPSYTRIPSPSGDVPSQGSLADPRGPMGGTPEPAQALIDLVVERLTNLITQVFEDHSSE